MLKEVVFLVDDQEKENFDQKLIKIEKANSLVVTDEVELFKQLQGKGFYVVGLHHEGNRDQFFEGASYVIEDAALIERKTYEEIYCRLAGLPILILETERLLIRESTVEDVEQFYEIYKEPSITDYMEDLFDDPEEEKAYMQDYIQKVYGFYGYGIWSVLLKKSGKVIGRAGLSVREGFDIPELGFMIGKEYQRKGYAYEACQAILRYAEEELAFEQVQALVEPENGASRKLLKKLDFAYQKRINIKNTIYEYWIL